MADEVFRRTLTQFSTMSPSFFPIKLKEKSFPVVGCSFSHTPFLLDYYYLDPSSVKAVPMKVFFEEGLNSLRSMPSSRNAQLACQQLKDFFSRDSDSVVAKLKEIFKTEKEFNCIFATEVLIPLSSGYCLINQKTSDVKDERLKLPKEGGVEGLVIGFPNGYYGEADMVIVPAYDESRTVLVSAPVEKQPRLDEEENSTSETDYGSPGKAVVEGKKGVQDSLSQMSQCVATVITFAQIQLKRHPEISYPIPMLKADPGGVVVLAYDYRSDLLMISHRLPWNQFGFFVVWLVLHYSLFRPKVLSGLEDFCSGYSAMSNDVSLGDPWYLKSTDVYSHSKKLFSFQHMSSYTDFMPGP
ncbi:uncharacterized protein [Montipora capricornis]|uniref:uncharacterized protein n=1 Tax=Montipora capricornis TaxID=246305 RepID=UPI0035F104AB